MLPSEIVRNERGADVCHRIKKMAVENVKGDPSKGFHYVDAYCNKPVVLNISENQKQCPDCDKQPPVGNVHPRVTNSAGVVLTPAELKECGVETDTSLLQKSETQKVPKKTRKAKEAVEAKVSKVKKDELQFAISLDSLEGDVDVAAFLIKKASAALDTLPVTNFAESKRLIRLQEKLESLLKV